MPRIYGTDKLDIIGMGGIGRVGATDDDDTIFGLGGDDWIFGLDGNDILMGGEGADHLFGGDGTDTATYMDSPEGVLVDLQTGHGAFGTAWGDMLESIENLTGSFYNDELYGDYHDNVLSGSWGDDWLEGRGGADILNGGLGRDYAVYSDSPAGVKVYLLWNFASGGDAEGDQLNSIENLGGSQFADGLMGDNGANELSGYGGDDTLFGLGGDDILVGYIGNDWLYGGTDNDSLWGQQGGDTLSGGPGADTFGWDEDSDSDGGVLPSGDVDWATMDTVLDFNPAEGDKIDARYIDANSGGDGYGQFTFIGEYYAAGGFTAPGQVAYGSDGTDTYLMFNTDEVFAVSTLNGSIPDFEFAIRFSGQYMPEANWFLSW
jgi:Ca2+-binding RTX toxin-like protein